MQREVVLMVVYILMEEVYGFGCGGGVVGYVPIGLGARSNVSQYDITHPLAHLCVHVPS